MSAYQQIKPKAITFESRVKEFSEQIQAETEGELSVEPLPCGYIDLLYKNKWIAKLHIGGLSKADVYERIVTIYKACSCFWSIETYGQ